ncbi:MAG: hypothetical protein KAY24_00335 [Candidatus Eisenbacteria sp.]|nr:hypothetical protein [Candidatus Eisenbacteria bacterium]
MSTIITEYATDRYFTLYHQHAYRRGVRRAVRLRLLLGGKCEDCGNPNIHLLVFYHAGKHHEVALGSTYIRERPWPELVQKVRECVLLCHNCYWERHTKPEYRDLQIELAAEEAESLRVEGLELWRWKERGKAD